jgi:subtilisin family serine protease
MRKSSINSRPMLAVLLCGLLLPVTCIGAASPAAAFGMFGFGRMGGFHGPAPGGGGLWRRMPAPQPGGGRFAGRNPRGGGWPTRHPPIGGGVVGVIGGGGRHGPNSNNSANNGGNPGRGGVPAQTDQSFMPNEIITAFVPNATPQAIDQIARRYELTRIESQNFPLIGSSLYRWRIGGSGTVSNVIRALGNENIVAGVQPNYVFTLQEEATKTSADKTSASRQGDAAQYVLSELQVEQAHQIATGKEVLVAVIDSEIDTKHADLGGTVVKSFDAVGGGENPHLHGTEMAGAIASHGKLLGIASGAQLLAIHAFDDTAGLAKSYSFAVYKGLQWAVDNNARIVNMSFAGHADPTLGRMLAAAYGKGVVLIAAAGNAGPQSEPLYPAADPNVIAVTATDSDEHLFAMANRGRYIAVAAPGVDILALAPGDTYQLTTGTSVAAAHVSGIAALLLERRPSLKPSDIRAVLITTARHLGPAVPDSDFGAGLVNAYSAITWLDRKPAEANDAGVQAKQ